MTAFTIKNCVMLLFIIISTVLSIIPWIFFSSLHAQYTQYANDKPKPKANLNMKKLFFMERQMINFGKQDIFKLKTPENKTTFKMPLIKGNNVISMSLYGSSEKYIVGALKNAENLADFFPGWKLWIYTVAKARASQKPKHKQIDDKVLSKLKSYGAEIHYVDPYKTSIPAMMWRFLVADDLSVDHFIVRDSDSRLSARDAAAVYQWILSGKAFHCIRDHPSHVIYAVSGGLWGGIPSALRGIFKTSFKELIS